MHVKEADVFHCFLEEGEKSYWVSDDKELLAKKYRKVINQTNEQPKIVHMLTSMHDTSSWDTRCQAHTDDSPIIKPISI